MQCKVLTVKEEDDVLIVQLDKGPFRPASCGQPCDLGTIRTRTFHGEITDVLYKNLIEVKPIKGKLKPVIVKCEVDENRRKLLTRMHTAEHILFRALEKDIEDLELDKIDLNEDISNVYLKAKELTWDDLIRAEEKANQIIQENRKIKTYDLKKEELKNHLELRIKPERIKEDSVRIVEIENYDKSACKGTHCKTTSEVKHILVTKLKTAGKNKHEIGFTVDVMEEMFKLARTARLATNLLGTETEKVPATIKNMKQELESLKNLSKNQKLEVKEESLNKIKFKYNTFENIDKKHLISHANDLMEKKTILCFINKAKETQILLFVSKDLKLDASELIKSITGEFGGKGGGRKDFAMCSIKKDTNKLLNYIKELISA